WPTYSGVLDQLADVYINKHEGENSVQLSKYALQVNDSDSWAHENLAEAYLQLKQMDNARAEWHKVVQLGDPGLVNVAKGYLYRNQ
ncbi:MAG: hypothetical protein ACLQVD_02130, partial [Capsulimonadaceae bacterium]